MPARIVLHAGFHKTGTSTVQAFLRANRKALHPYVAIRLKGQMQEVMAATRRYSVRRDPLSLLEVAQSFVAVLEDLPDLQDKTLLLSAEELCGHMPGRHNVADYSAAPELAEVYSETIRARFPSTPLAMFLTTRTAESWLESAYWEHVKSSSMTSDLEVFLERTRPAADLPAVANRMAQATNVEVQKLDVTGPADPIGKLLDLCDVPIEAQAQLTPVPRANTRLPTEVLLALLQANRAYPDRAARKAAKDAILKDHSAP